MRFEDGSDRASFQSPNICPDKIISELAPHPLLCIHDKMAAAGLWTENSCLPPEPDRFFSLKFFGPPFAWAKTQLKLDAPGTTLHRNSNRKKISCAEIIISFHYIYLFVGELHIVVRGQFLGLRVHHVGPWGQNQLIRLGGRCLYLLTYVESPQKSSFHGMNRTQLRPCIKGATVNWSAWNRWSRWRSDVHTSLQHLGTCPSLAIEKLFGGVFGLPPFLYHKLLSAENRRQMTNWIQLKLSDWQSLARHQLFTI